MLVHGLKHSEKFLVHVGTEETTELEKMRIGADLDRAPCASAWPSAFRKISCAWGFIFCAFRRFPYCALGVRDPAVVADRIWLHRVLVAISFAPQRRRKKS